MKTELSDLTLQPKLLKEETQNFPWLCAKENCTDLEGDDWQIVVSCTDLTPAQQSSQAGKVEAKFLVAAFCTISGKNLQRMGFSPSRLAHVVGIEQKHVEMQTILTAMCKIEEVQAKGSQMAIKAKTNFLSKFTYNEKQSFLWKRIQGKTFSNFDGI